MSVFDVLNRYGTRALLGFLVIVATFLALHLIRLPLLSAVHGLEALIRRIDTTSPTPSSPIANTATKPVDHQ